MIQDIKALSETFFLVWTDGCLYKGVSYNAGQTWKDGCFYTCECLDMQTGRYRCKDRCKNLNIIFSSVRGQEFWATILPTGLFVPCFESQICVFLSVDARPWMASSHHPTARSSLTLQIHAVRWCSADNLPPPPHSIWSQEPNPRSLAASPLHHNLTTHRYPTHTKPLQTTPLCQHLRVSSSSWFFIRL